MNRIAVFPGSFDPFTIGHLSVVERGLKLFDKIIIAIGINDHKPMPENLEPRLENIRKATSNLDGVEVVSYTGLTVDLCKEKNAEFILRGVRSVADYEYERTLADVNRTIAGIETILLYSLPELSAVNSSVVRELNRYGYDTSKFLP